jgi:nicotinamidase-related amidase
MTRLLVLVVAGLLVVATVVRAGPAEAAVVAQRAPELEPVTLDPATTALLVLDLSARCDSPQQVCSQLVPAVSSFLDRARANNVFVVYTVSFSALGTPLGDVWQGFRARPDEPVLYPDAFDKFHDGELHALLAARGIDTVIATGSSTNVGVLYTVTGAARHYGYRVIVPVDGVNASGAYEQEYALYQMSVLPVASQFTFTTLDQISFGGR